MARESREVWEKRIERWADSGLSAKEFAAEIGVNWNTLAGWKWRLSGAAKRATAVASAASAPSFVEVVAPLVAGVSEVEVAPVASSKAAAEPIELILPSGIRVRVPPCFDPTALHHIVDTLEAR